MWNKNDCLRLLFCSLKKTFTQKTRMICFVTFDIYKKAFFFKLKNKKEGKKSYLWLYTPIIYYIPIYRTSGASSVQFPFKRTECVCFFPFLFLFWCFDSYMWLYAPVICYIPIYRHVLLLLFRSPLNGTSPFFLSSFFSFFSLSLSPPPPPLFLQLHTIIYLYYTLHPYRQVPLCFFWSDPL